jgi:2-polyprenyl-3-methyl-5-hydroxy-6-metoxy-1,4-benzoquinol methylase
MRFKAMAERAKLEAYRAYLPDGGRALDVGCGDGHLLIQLAGDRRASLRLEGVEFSEAAARAAEARGLTVHRGRIEDVSLPEATFDLVIMNQLIEHVADPVARDLPDEPCSPDLRPPGGDDRAALTCASVHDRRPR